MSQRMRSVVVAVSAVMLAAAFAAKWLGLGLMMDVFLLAATGAAGFPIARKAFQALRMKVFSIELLVTIAVIGALIIGEYTESAAVTFLFLFGAYLEAKTLAKTRSSIKALMDLVPAEANVIRKGESVQLPVEELTAGDRVLICSGDKVPADGFIDTGTGFLNEAAITGEPYPARKNIGDHVFAGTILDSGYIEVIAEKVGDDTTYSKIIELVEEAQEAKAKTQKFLEKFANLYTPAIVILSILVYIITKDIDLTLTFLVIACPGALVISAPVSIVAGIGNGAKNGILIKGGEMIEKFARVNAVVFDKTGTLTKGQPEITEIAAMTINENDLLQFAAQAETISEHHLGQTIVQEAKSRNLSLNEKPDEAEVIKGLGITGKIQKNVFAIGNRKLMLDKEIYIPRGIEIQALGSEKKGNTVIFVAINKEIAGLISIADQIRPEAAEAIRKLKANGIKKIYMLTGDNRHTANLVANKLGIDHVLAEMLPEDKVTKVKQLQEEGYRVAMVGDGINDAPSIAAADIGLAIGGAGTDAAMETADAVLMSGKLDKLVHALKLSKATVRNMKQNTYFAVSTVILLLGGVLLKKVFLASGMLIHELSVLIVILNAIRLVGYNSERKKKQEADPAIMIEKGV